MNISFDGKVIIVTGAAPGFGQAISHAFCERGAQVWGCDLDKEGLSATEALCGEHFHGEVLDVADEAAVAGFVKWAGHSTGRVDILVNNAGGILDQTRKPIEEVTREGWDRVFAANVTGAFNFVRAVAPAMKAAPSGRIVNISSGAGLGIAALTGIQAYTAAKSALIGLTRQLAFELGPWGITVNSIAPGFVRSNPKTEAQWQAHTDERRRSILEGIYLKRLGTPEDIVYAVLFFASEYAGWITGQTLSVNGGK
jgi:3-oxoacyl-[acyl-carrier protein] reductase